MSEILYEGVIFKEHPILTPTQLETEDDHDYAITAQPFIIGSDREIDESFIDLKSGEFSQRYYCLALLLKLSQLSSSQVDDFLDYQLRYLSDIKRWLLKLERLVELTNEDSFFILHHQRLGHAFAPIRDRITEIRRSPDPDKKTGISGKDENKSFSYIDFYTDSGRLTDFCNYLKNKGFISKDTTSSNFKKAFSGDTISQPIVWQKDTNDLHYLIMQIHTTHKLVRKENNYWKIAAMCFVDSDGRSYDANNLRKSGDPTDTSLLDKAIALLK